MWYWSTGSCKRNRPSYEGRLGRQAPKPPSSQLPFALLLHISNFLVMKGIWMPATTATVVSHKGDTQWPRKSILHRRRNTRRRKRRNIHRKSDLDLAVFSLGGGHLPAARRAPGGTPAHASSFGHVTSALTKLRSACAPRSSLWPAQPRASPRVHPPRTMAPASLRLRRPPARPRGSEVLSRLMRRSGRVTRQAR
jgi:hypothetical protein